MIPLPVGLLANDHDCEFFADSTTHIEQPTSLDALALAEGEYVLVGYLCSNCDNIHYLLIPDSAALEYIISMKEAGQLNVVAWFVCPVTVPDGVSLQQISDAFEEELRIESEKEAEEAAARAAKYAGMTDDEIAEQMAQEIAEMMDEIIAQITSGDNDDDDDDQNHLIIFGIDLT